MRCALGISAAENPFPSSWSYIPFAIVISKRCDKGIHLQAALRDVPALLANTMVQPPLSLMMAMLREGASALEHHHPSDLTHVLRKLSMLTP